MKEIINFDVRLKDLMNLGEHAKGFGKLKALFLLLKTFWYRLDDKKEQVEREDRIRIGSVYVFLDDDGVLHMDFVTRFNFENKDAYHKAFEILALMPDDISLPEEFLALEEQD